MLDGRGIGEERKKLVCVRVCVCVCVRARACVLQTVAIPFLPPKCIYSHQRENTPKTTTIFISAIGDLVIVGIY